MLLNNAWVNNKIKEEVKNYLETNKNELMTTQNLWDTVEAVLREKCIALQAYLKKTNKQTKIPNKPSNFTLKGIEKGLLKNPKVSREREIVKTRA